MTPSGGLGQPSRDTAVRVWADTADLVDSSIAARGYLAGSVCRSCVMQARIVSVLSQVAEIGLFFAAAAALAVGMLVIR